jgi:hypothetical protein
MGATCRLLTAGSPKPGQLLQPLRAWREAFDRPLSSSVMLTIVIGIHRTGRNDDAMSGRRLDQDSKAFKRAETQQVCEPRGLSCPSSNSSLTLAFAHASIVASTYTKSR